MDARGTGGVPRPEVVLFDLDGTLADTFGDLLAALDDALEAHGLPASDARAVRARVSQGASAMTRAAVTATGDEALLERVCRRFLDNYQDNLAHHTRLFPGMDAVLACIEEGGLAWGVVTNKVARLTHPIIDALGLRHRLSALVSGDSAARPKPHPDPLRMALDMVPATAAVAVYVGDARNDVLAARAAGTAVVAAAYGYLAPGEDPGDWGADAIIHHPCELVDWLELPSAR